MRKCCACGKRFNLLAKNRYEVVVKPAGLECLTKRTTYFNAFDCPHCGCQNIVGIVEKEQKAVEVLDEIRAEILDEAEYAYADFEQYKVDYLGADAEYVEDELPQDDFRYGMERAIEIIDKYKKENEEE